MKIKSKKIILVLLLLLLIFFIFIYLFIMQKPQSSLPSSDSQKNSLTTNTSGVTRTEQTEQIIKCQNVVVTPGNTTELYTYVSGNRVRYDFRIGTSDEKTSFKHQILYDGTWLYVWNPALRFDSTVPVNNPPGVKVKLASYAPNIDVSILDSVERFGASPLSGDRLCTVWDDVDPVFEVPNTVEFIESPDTNKTIQENRERICTVCGDSENPSSVTCRKNLQCAE